MPECTGAQSRVGRGKKASHARIRLQQDTTICNNIRLFGKWCPSSSSSELCWIVLVYDSGMSRSGTRSGSRPVQSPSRLSQLHKRGLPSMQKNLRSQVQVPSSYSQCFSQKTVTSPLPSCYLFHDGMRLGKCFKGADGAAAHDNQNHKS